MTSPQLTLRVLGPPVVELDGRLIQLERRKAIALLVYLAVTGEKHTREALATLLSPEFETNRARHELRRTISVINKALPTPVLVADREVVHFEPPPGFQLDRQTYVERLAASRRHDHGGNALCAKCEQLLREAVELYRADFLAGFALQDSPQFDEWQFFEADGLRRDQAQALQRLTGHHGRQGDYATAIEYARRWLALDALHEPAHRQLMELYAWADQRAAALRQYEECMRVLKRELDVAPQAETTTLYESIKRKALMRHAYLRVLGGPGATKGRRFRLSAQTVIGHSRRRQIYLNDPYVSKEHALIDGVSGQFLLRDLGSTNGTKVNGSKLPADGSHRLAPGDVVKIGDTQLEFEFLEPDSEPDTVDLSTEIQPE